MPSLTQLLAFTALAVLSFTARAQPHCPGAQVEKDTTIDVGGQTVHLISMSCDAGVQARQDATADTASPRDVCGELCTNSCNDNAGNLPPISQDCDTIENAITILQNAQPDSFTVDPYHITTLTFGTCSYFFSNTGSKSLEYCWSALSSTASGAGSACFPPVMPISSEGLCTSSDYTWAVGAAHSAGSS